MTQTPLAAGELQIPAGATVAAISLAGGADGGTIAITDPTGATWYAATLGPGGTASVGSVNPESLEAGTNTITITGTLTGTLTTGD